MERAVWTDERLDDLAARVDDGFARVDADIRELRQTMLQVAATINIMMITMLVGFIGVIATILTTS